MPKSGPVRLFRVCVAIAIAICALLYYVDIDECTTGVHNCAQDQCCVNTPGGYYCECFSGYEIIGGVCKGNSNLTSYLFIID